MLIAPIWLKIRTSNFRNTFPGQTEKEFRWQVRRFDTIHTCDGRTDYGIAVAYMHYSIGLLSQVKSNAINFKKAFWHAGRLFETARLRQTKSSFLHVIEVLVGKLSHHSNCICSCFIVCGSCIMPFLWLLFPGIESGCCFTEWWWVFASFCISWPRSDFSVARCSGWIIRYYYSVDVVYLIMFHTICSFMPSLLRMVVFAIRALKVLVRSGIQHFKNTALAVSKVFFYLCRR